MINLKAPIFVSENLLHKFNQGLIRLFACVDRKHPLQELKQKLRKLLQKLLQQQQLLNWCVNSSHHEYWKPRKLFVPDLVVRLFYLILGREEKDRCCKECWRRKGKACSRCCSSQVLTTSQGSIPRLDSTPLCTVSLLYSHMVSHYRHGVKLALSWNPSKMHRPHTFAQLQDSILANCSVDLKLHGPNLHQRNWSSKAEKLRYRPGSPTGSREQLQTTCSVNHSKKIRMMEPRIALQR